MSGVCAAKEVCKPLGSMFLAAVTPRALGRAPRWQDPCSGRRRASIWPPGPACRVPEESKGKEEKEWRERGKEEREGAAARKSVGR